VTRWLVVIAAGLLTYAIRSSLIFAGGRVTMPVAARSALRFVTVAALAALIVPAVLYAGAPAHLDAGPGNERVPAALLAAVVARVTDNIWLTIVAGMGAFWLLRAFT